MNYYYNIGEDFETGTLVTITLNVDGVVETGDFAIENATDVADALTSLGNDTFVSIENGTVIYVNSQSGTTYGTVTIGEDSYLVELTVKYLFTNDESEIVLSRNETIAWNTNAKFWSGFYGFTPEGYGMIDAQLYGLSMVSFKQGVPYFHNLSNETTYNNFYGYQMNQWITIVFNEHPETEKRFLTLMLDSKNKTSTITAVKYDLYNIETSDNQLSNLPKESFTFKENMVWAALMRSTNLGKTLQNGNQLRGTWIEITMRRDNSESVIDTYSEFSKAIINYFTSSKTY